VILSGVSLGLAIFTKTSSISMIPLIVFLIFQGLNRSLPTNRLKIFSSWIIPVILIPSMWPFYALVTGDLDQWIDGVFWQAAGRYTEGKTLPDTISSSFKTDPILLTLGTVGIIYMTVRRDYFPILWVAPYIVLLYLVGWSTHFHLILIIPVLCISISKLIFDLPGIIRLRKNNTVISSVIVFAIVLFGLITTTILISTNLSYIQLETAAYISNEIVSKNEDSLNGTTNSNINSSSIGNGTTNDITVISSPVFSWLWKYVFNHDHSFSNVRDTQSIKTGKILIASDYTYRLVVNRAVSENETQVERLKNLYDNSHRVVLFRELPSEYMKRDYPFAGILSAKTGSLTTEIRTNY